MSILASIKTQVPDLTTFVVRATVPLPGGYTYAPKEDCPFTVIDPDGNDLVTQWDVVSRYANGDVAVAKISAQAFLKNMSPGSEQHFSIKSQASTMNVAGIDKELTDVLLKNDKIRFRAVDVHGNIYEESISYDTSDNKSDRLFRMHEMGPVTLTAEIAGWLRAAKEEPTELPYFGGLIWWLTARSDSSNVIDLAIDWHNGGESLPLYNLYFKTIELVLPAGWDAISDWPEPLMGEPKLENGETVIPLVMPQPDGKMHLLPQRQERIWRLYLHKSDNKGAAEEIASQRGWGVCEDGVDLWSWRNAETANYFPQRAIMPSLSHFDAAGELRSAKAQKDNELANGLPWNGVQGEGQMGIWNPAGVGYGGMTGGDDIYQWSGVRTLMTGEPNGLLLHRSMHRRYTDRAKAAFYSSDGTHVHQDSFLNSDGSAPWRMFNNEFQKRSWPNDFEKYDEPWEFSKADEGQASFVNLHGLQPDYENALMSYMPIDHQHLIRRVKDIKALIWLDNDPIARKHLAVQAELNRMTYAEYNGGRYRAMLDDARANRNKGGDWGREHAWNLDCNVSHYAISSDEERERWKPWMDATRDMLGAMQMPNSSWMRIYHGKIVYTPPSPYENKFSASQSNQQVFSMHALRGLMRSVYEGVDADSSELCADMLKKAAIGMWNFFWAWKQDLSGPSANGPWSSVAVGTMDPREEVFVNHDDHPPQQWGPGLEINSWHVGNALAIALDIAMGTQAEKTVLDIIRVYTNSTDPARFLIDQDGKQLDSRAFLLALLQSM